MAEMLDLLKQLTNEFIGLGQLRITDDTWFEGVKRGAITKTFEFCLAVCADREDEHVFFFLAPTLRGIWEDLIAVTFLQRLPERARNRASIVKAMLVSIEASEKQKRFFERERRWQPVVSYPDVQKRKQQFEDELKSIGGATGLWSKKQVFPLGIPHGGQDRPVRGL
jgi:hypothetical protein